MDAGGGRFARAALLAALASGCLASPPPSELVDRPDAAVTATCMPGQRVAGEPFNASPVDPESACDVDNAGAPDGAVAGLDRTGSLASSCSMWGEPDIGACGCVAPPARPAAAAATPSPPGSARSATSTRRRAR